MTWSKFDDAAPKSPKAAAAGNEAWGLWAAAVMYCNRHNTDGYITISALATDCLPEAIPVGRARKLADKLCDARVRPEGKGLFELDRKDTYRVHDFLDWNPSKVEVEEARRVARERKVGPKLRGLVLAEHGLTCSLCGGAIMGLVHIDHVIPVARGGKTELANLKPAHPRCNVRKGARLTVVA